MGMGMAFVDGEDGDGGRVGFMEWRGCLDLGLGP